MPSLTTHVATTETPSTGDGSFSCTRGLDTGTDQMTEKPWVCHIDQCSVALALLPTGLSGTLSGTSLPPNPGFPHSHRELPFKSGTHTCKYKRAGRSASAGDNQTGCLTQHSEREVQVGGMDLATGYEQGLA